MVLVMMSILMHMMAAGSLSGMEHGVHPITTNLGNQVSVPQGVAKKIQLLEALRSRLSGISREPRTSIT